jgi:hypoxanthine phosphoribosyltransferase
MKRINVYDKEFELTLSSETIQKRIQELAIEISNDLKDLNPVFLGILNGSFMFASDLLKRINFDARITFLKLASYQGTTASGKVQHLIGLNQDIKDLNIVILEDIVDTGKTMDTIIRQLNVYQPASIRIATLLYKPDSCKEEIKLDYIGFTIPNKFVVGYGLDYKGYGRKYKDIYSIVKEG